MVIDFQPACYVQSRQPLDQAAQSHIQPGLECLQGIQYVQYEELLRSICCYSVF